MGVALTEKGKRSPALIWYQIQGIVAMQLADPDQLMRLEDEATLRGLDSPELLPMKLACFDPAKVLRLILKEAPRLPLYKLEEITPQQVDELMDAIMSLFESRSDG